MENSDGLPLFHEIIAGGGGGGGGGGLGRFNGHLIS